MANKTKNKTPANQIQSVVANTGLLLMTAAAATLMLEVPEQHNERRAVLTPQPAYAAPGQIADREMHTSNNEMRRERDETHPHYASYSVTQRTPGRTGRA